MRYNRKLTATIICIAFIIHSCIYEFSIKSGNYENCLVIYGMITTDNGPHEIVISTSRKMDYHGTVFVSGAKVSLSDNNENSIALTEVSAGRYHTPESFAGQIGTKYKLNIELQEGKQYESDYVQLLDVPGISELKAEHLTKHATATDEEVEGFQFYISTEPGNSEQKYLKWEIIDNSEYHLAYIFYNYWDGLSLTDVSIPNRCYIQSHLKDISIATTDNFQTNCLVNYPLCFSPKSWKLKFGYGIYVRQYALSDFSYNFWKGALEDNLPDPMNSKQPYQLTGNLKCISNPNEPVYGIFEASAVKAKGIKIKNLYYSIHIQREIPVCKFARVISNSTDDLRGWYPGYLGVPESPPPFWTGYVLMTDKNCVFCENSGGTSIRPDYWGANK
jgi:hypothetical protein